MTDQKPVRYDELFMVARSISDHLAMSVEDGKRFEEALDEIETVFQCDDSRNTKENLVSYFKQEDVVATHFRLAVLRGLLSRWNKVSKEHEPEKWAKNRSCFWILIEAGWILD
jgi:hypothetical protein